MSLRWWYLIDQWSFVLIYFSIIISCSLHSFLPLSFIPSFWRCRSMCVYLCSFSFFLYNNPENNEHIKHIKHCTNLYISLCLFVFVYLSIYLYIYILTHLYTNININTNIHTNTLTLIDPTRPFGPITGPNGRDPSPDSPMRDGMSRRWSKQYHHVSRGRWPGGWPEH